MKRYRITVGELRYATHHLMVGAESEDDACAVAKEFIADPQGRPSPFVTYASRAPRVGEPGSGSLEVLDIQEEKSDD